MEQNFQYLWKLFKFLIQNHLINILEKYWDAPSTFLMHFLIYFADIFLIKMWSGLRCIKLAFSNSRRSVELTGNNAHHSFVECNPPCSSLFLEKDKRERERKSEGWRGFIIPPCTFVWTDHIALMEFFHTIHVRINTIVWTCVFYVSVCAHTSFLALASLFPRSFEPLPLCGGSHLALFKEILMVLDRILRPNFAAGSFAESGNPSHIAHFRPLFAILSVESINK